MMEKLADSVIDSASRRDEHSERVPLEQVADEYCNGKQSATLLLQKLIK